jgi:hypothetical protein
MAPQASADQAKASKQVPADCPARSTAKAAKLLQPGKTHTSLCAAGHAGTSTATGVIDLSNSQEPDVVQLLGTSNRALGRTLILFDDFDTLADEDPGFLPALRTLLLQSKARVAARHCSHPCQLISWYYALAALLC